MRHGFIAVDGGYGKEPAFLRSLDVRGKHFATDVHKDQHVYVTAPQPAVRTGVRRGRQPGRPATGIVPVRAGNAGWLLR